jgi:tryptophan synthase alpha chain
MNRINKVFSAKNHNILSIYYTAGFPSLNDTVPIAQYLEEAGADLIEIGMPFSDPVADGPTVQASNKRALDNGMTTKLLLEQVKEIRKTVSIPIILMGYFNPVVQFGVEKFVREAAAAGVDGVILPDLPFLEFEESYKELFASAGMGNTFLISPTTSEERIRKIDNASSGFVYAVSSSSTTGAKSGFTPEQIDYFEKLKKMNLKNPFLIGFGISDHATFSKASEYAAGAIIGSAFVNLLNASTNLKGDIMAYVNSVKTGK